MASTAQANGSAPVGTREDFSLILGGPLFQLWRRLRLVDDSLKLVPRRMAMSCLVCWLPLLVISTLEGRLVSGATVPFLFDLEMHVRFLIAMPLLIGSELVVHRRLLPVIKQFTERRLVPKGAVAEFDAAVTSALQLRNSLVAELSLIAFVYVMGVLVWQRYTALDASTWYVTSSGSGSRQHSLAGLWYGYVSLPLFQFLMVRWYFRIFIWARLLRRISRIELNVFPTHPDHVGGLGFLSATVSALAPIAVAHGVLLAGQLADRIVHLGAKLTDFKTELLLLVLFLLVLVLGPLLLFAPQLARVKRSGRLKYEALAQRYVSEFDNKWLQRGDARAHEVLLGSGDIQSLADLNNSLDVVRSMRVAPITRDAVVQLTVATLLPILPLLLTMMPLEELLRKLFGLLF